MATLIDKLRQLIRLNVGQRKHSLAQSGNAAAAECLFDEATTKKLMALLGQTEEEEYSCEETFALLDEYAELIHNNAEAKAFAPIVKHHLDMCPDCHERYEALLRILEMGET